MSWGPIHKLPGHYLERWVPLHRGRNIHFREFESRKVGQTSLFEQEHSLCQEDASLLSFDFHSRVSFDKQALLELLAIWPS